MWGTAQGAPHLSTKWVPEPYLSSYAVLKRRISAYSTVQSKLERLLLLCDFELVGWPARWAYVLVVS